MWVPGSASARNAGGELRLEQGQDGRGGPEAQRAREDAVVPAAAGFLDPREARDELVPPGGALARVREHLDRLRGLEVRVEDVVRRDAVGLDVRAGLLAAALELVPVREEGAHGEREPPGIAAAEEGERALDRQHPPGRAGQPVHEAELVLSHLRARLARRRVGDAARAGAPAFEGIERVLEHALRDRMAAGASREERL